LTKSHIDPVSPATAEGWNRVIDGWPSTHILKPESRDYPASIYDEDYGARFTRAAGLTSFPTWVEESSAVGKTTTAASWQTLTSPNGRSSPTARQTEAWSWKRSVSSLLSGMSRRMAFGN
jgi:hypothetical protein